MIPAHPIFVVGAGHAHPDLVVTSEDLEERIPGLSPGWSKKHLGMESRHVLAPHEWLVALARDATTMALRNAQWDEGTVDLIIQGSAFPSQILPAGAAYIAQQVSPNAVAFDVGAACSSNIFALANAVGLMAIGDKFRRAVVATADNPTAWADYSDAHSSIFFGDSAGAMALASSPGVGGSFEILGVELLGDSERPEAVVVPRSGYFGSDGRYSLAQVVRLSRLALKRVCAECSVPLDNIRYVAPHQANFRIIDFLAEFLSLPSDHIWQNYEWAGNQGASGLMTAFSQGWQHAKTQLSNGDVVALVSVGGGYTGGAALLRWTETA